MTPALLNFLSAFLNGAAWGLGLAAASPVMGFAWQMGAAYAARRTRP